MQLETIEFVIHPDGRVQELVTGIAGSSCVEVTAAIEAKLGRVLSKEQTSEFYTVPTQQALQTYSQQSVGSW
ncbi:MAG: DUF2997 domain-containing protein [Cyanobacteria bacterium]|nr:DUF2997 domain-containing protein [Cyanobacteriota bacterium]MDW8200207.1 DUF2997 domain-containing protein [Cyanobacteriota bacterium SKYGB_h_bin112]